MRWVRAGISLSGAALLACLHEPRQAVGEGSSGESEGTDATNGDDAPPSTQGLPDDGTPTTTEPPPGDDGETSSPGTTTAPPSDSSVTGSPPSCVTHEDCGAGMICDGDCRRPLHCAELLAAWPETGTGDHPLDPDGDGTEATFTCDMDHDGGGWTRVLLEDFASSDGTAWSAAVVSACGNLGQMLGGSGNFAGGTVDRGVELYGIAHAQARLLARFIKIDSWDQEVGFAQIDGVEVWTVQCNFDRCGPDSQCGSGTYPEGEHPVDATTDHAGATMTLTFGATLDQGASNEAWGVDDIEVWLR